MDEQDWEKTLNVNLVKHISFFCEKTFFGCDNEWMKWFTFLDPCDLFPQHAVIRSTFLGIELMKNGVIINMSSTGGKL